MTIFWTQNFLTFCVSGNMGKCFGLYVEFFVNMLNVSVDMLKVSINMLNVSVDILNVSVDMLNVLG